MRIACIMMQKNEASLLWPWIRYHAELFGAENLYIFDNGSSCDSVLGCLQKAVALGVHVDKRYWRQDDFNRKGEILTELIQSLDAEGRYDFYLPMDCDEFVACAINDGLSLEKEDILATLASHQGSNCVLMISHKLHNNPCRPNVFSLNLSSKKCFFARNTCEWLDKGYHHGRARNGGTQVATDIVYVEFHYRPYRSQRDANRQKLTGLVPDFSRRSLKIYAEKRRSGFHCARELLLSEHDYIKQFIDTKEIILFSQIFSRFEVLGVSTEPLLHALPPVPLQLWLTLLRIRMVAAEYADGFLAMNRSLARLPRRALGRLWRSLKAYLQIHFSGSR